MSLSLKDDDSSRNRMWEKVVNGVSYKVFLEQKPRMPLLYGLTAEKDGNMLFTKNAGDLDKFKFDLEVQNEMMQMLGEVKEVVRGESSV